MQNIFKTFNGMVIINLFWLMKISCTKYVENFYTDCCDFIEKNVME